MNGGSDSDGSKLISPNILNKLARHMSTSDLARMATTSKDFARAAERSKHARMKEIRELRERILKFQSKKLELQSEWQKLHRERETLCRRFRDLLGEYHTNWDSTFDDSDDSEYMVRDELFPELYAKFLLHPKVDTLFDELEDELRGDDTASIDSILRRIGSILHFNRFERLKTFSHHEDRIYLNEIIKDETDLHRLQAFSSWFLDRLGTLRNRITEIRATVDRATRDIQRLRSAVRNVGMGDARLSSFLAPGGRGFLFPGGFPAQYELLGVGREEMESILGEQQRVLNAKRQKYLDAFA